MNTDMIKVYATKRPNEPYYFRAVDIKWIQPSENPKTCIVVVDLNFEDRNIEVNHTVEEVFKMRDKVMSNQYTHCATCSTLPIKKEQPWEFCKGCFYSAWNEVGRWGCAAGKCSNSTAPKSDSTCYKKFSH